MMTPEQESRQLIDRQLMEAGWEVQDYKTLNLSSSLGVAVREFPLEGGITADYMLFIDRKAVGVIEAKPEGTTLGGVSEQSQKYLEAFPQSIPHHQLPLPFSYEASGTEIFFRDIRDPDYRSRRVFHFHRPETLKEWVEETTTLRQRLKRLPVKHPLQNKGLREAQHEAIRNLEFSLAENRPRALIQMATGSGKTYVAVAQSYRLIKYAKAKRILFLVDRANLGRQTLREFQNYISPDDGRKFTELYNVQLLNSRTIDPVSKVCISTIQRMYSILKGEELEEELDERSLFELSAQVERPLEVKYNPQVPIETFDFIIIDECHRSIYNLWRQVLEYFDAFLIGLTATPSKHTIAFFNKNLVMEYPHERAVADNVNVPYDVYRIRTKISEKGAKIEAGFNVRKRDKLTRQQRWELLDEDVEYDAKQLDRSVVAVDQIRTIIRTFKEKLFTELFPGRKEVPKTIIFAKDDSHADDIVHIVREEFGKGNEFCKKITYKTTGEKPEDLISSFRNSYNPRIVVTVDMISTGTDIKPVECLIFMRDVKSRVLFEQMKGRGTRVITPDDLRAVTPDAKFKTHFIIVDAVGVTDNDKTDSRPLERKRSVPFEKLLHSVALGIRDEDTLLSLGNRLARLQKTLSPNQQQEIEQKAGKRLKDIINDLFRATDPDEKVEKAKEIFGTQSPTEEQIKKAQEELINEACKPFDNPDLRNTLVEIKKANEQIIDDINVDEVTYVGFDAEATERAKKTIESFKKFIEENRNEIDALQILYNLPYSKRHLTYKQIKELAERIQKPPYNLTPEHIWKAYEQLEKSKVRGAGSVKLLTDIISLVRFALGIDSVLMHFPDIVNQNFERWLKEQEKNGRKFTEQQIEWLKMIKDHIATSVHVTKDDFDLPPFNERGGLIKFYELFGEDIEKILEELNKELVA